MVDIILDFFVKDGDVYNRFTEEFSERAYSDDELKAALDSAGFETVAIFGDMTFSAPSDNEERKIFVARKI